METEHVILRRRHDAGLPASDAADLARAAAQTKPAKLRDPSVSRQVQRQMERRTAKRVRSVTTGFRANEVFDGFVPRGRVWAVTPPAQRFVEGLGELIADAKARVDAMTPAEQESMFARQREGYARAEADWPKPRYSWVNGVKVYASYEDYCND